MTMAAPSVSIAMATYNGGRFIQEQLASFVDQQRRPDELMITDDGSSDDTLAIVDAFAAEAPFTVRVERNPERLGYTRNFERAIGLASGEVILISDQDDCWYPTKITIILAAMEAADHPIVTVNDQLIVDQQGRDQGMTMFGNFRRARCPDTDLIAGSCTALPRSLLPLLMPFPGGVPYDSWIGSVADSLGIKHLIDEPLQTYRRHGSNASQPIVATRTPTQWSAFRRYGMNDPRPGWHAEILWRGELAHRLGRLATELDAIAGNGASVRAAAVQQRRMAALRQRMLILDRPRARRWASVLRHWRSGMYTQFLGARSAVKDLLRP